jgi:hypothetical protein
VNLAEKDFISGQFEENQVPAATCASVVGGISAYFRNQPTML